MIFRPKPPIDQAEYEWLVACFAWLRTVLDDSDIRPELVLPNHPKIATANTAGELFDAVRALCGMEDWPCQLEKIDDSFETGDARIEYQGDTAAGTYSVESDVPVIRYAESMLQDPAGLAATFAHELSHYLTDGVGDPPGGPDLMEHATDCCAAYLGFGVLLANNARDFQQWTDGEWQGWRAATRGYLSEQALVTATAMFAALHGHRDDSIAKSLKPYLRKDFAKAKKAIARDHPDFPASMAGVNLLEWNYG